MGVAGLLTKACLLKSGISQPLLDSNEIYAEGSGRGCLLNTKPARVKLFRRGQGISPRLAVRFLAPGPLVHRSRAGIAELQDNAQGADGSWEESAGEADLHSDKHRNLFPPLPLLVPYAVTL